jgi:dimethylaniline monooxygenase (N-oxide forming)
MRHLFKHAFSPAAGHSLCYIGFARPTAGGFLMSSELVARYFALLMSGTRQLPREAVLRQRISEDMAREQRTFIHGQDTNILINFLDFNNALAQLIGCYCSPLRWILDPRFFLKWQITTHLACRYRMVGPHAKPELARRWILQCLTANDFSRLLIDNCLRIASLLGLCSADSIRVYRRIANFLSPS